MITLNNRIRLVVVLTALLLGSAACQEKSPVIDFNGETETPEEAMVEAAAEAGDIERTIALADSFVNLNQLSSVRGDFYKAMACDRKNNYPAMAEHIKRIIKAYEEGTDEHPLFYSRAAISLSGLYLTRGQYEEALNVAMPALARFESDPNIQSDWKGFFLSTIGECQLYMNQPEEGEKNLEQAYYYYKAYMHEPKFKLLDFTTCIIDVYSISSMFNGKETLKEQLKWTDRCDSLLTWYSQQPGADSAFVEKMEGMNSLNRAEILYDQGKKAEADKAFEKFLETSYSKGDEGRFLSCTYLAKSGRYTWAADIYQDLDRYASMWGMKPNMEFITGFLFSKFRYNYQAGRKDSAFAVAVKIAELIDSASIKQKEDAAAELTTIYETQKKEAQIVQQQTELSHQRMIGLVIAFFALVIFFLVIDLNRRKSSQRLAKLNAAKERIENELKIARDIQMSMVPSTFPAHDRLDMYASMTPAKEVGGDLYGYVLIDSKLYFAVGDVSGKGVPASLFMAQATQLFRTLSAQQMMPAEICTRMNDALSGEENESGMFVTLFLGRLNLETGHLDFCNAGHNPPVLVNSGRADFLEMVPNAPIGLWPGLEFEGEEIDTIQGTPLFIYTDGLNEAENSQQEQFGDHRLLNMLRHIQYSSAQQVVETMAEAVTQHRNGAEPNDDLTMMCIHMMA